MSLTKQLKEDMKAALRGGDKRRLAAVRIALAAINQREVDTRKTLDDEQVLSLLEKLIKQGRDAAAQFAAAGRMDLAEKEQSEIATLGTYLPEPLSETEIEALITTSITQTGATSMRDMGKVMAAIKASAAGRVDMAALGPRVKAKLGSG